MNRVTYFETSFTRNWLGEDLEAINIFKTDLEIGDRFGTET